MKGLLLIALALFFFSSCATVGPRFGRRLPYEAKVYLLDAEEDLMTAKARADQQWREVHTAKKAVGAAEDRFDNLRESPLAGEAKAQVKVAQAQLTREERLLELLDAAAVCAERRYVATRSRAEVKFKVNGADETEANDLADRATACEAKLEKKQVAVAEAEEALSRARSEQERASIAAAQKAPLENPRPWIE